MPVSINGEVRVTTLTDVMRVLDEQNQDPPGGDKYIAGCYGAILDRINRHDELTEDIITSSLHLRPHISPQYFANLLFRAIQYVEIYRLPKDNNYPHNLGSKSAWKAELGGLFKIYADDIKDLLAKKDTSTTVYQRYAGPQALLRGFFGDKPLRVGDLGCGGNVGLPGISLGIPFDAIEDRTPHHIVSNLLEKPPSIEKGVAVDREDPHDPEAKKWRTACSFYPSEFKRLAQASILEARVTKATNVKFFKADLLTMPIGNGSKELQPDVLDSIILSTVLYQLTPQEQQIVLNGARQMVTSSGNIIIEDFAKKSTEGIGLNFDTNWFANDGWAYRTFVLNADTEWKPKEVLQWANGRCTKVRAGEDFQLIADTPADAQATS